MSHHDVVAADRFPPGGSESYGRLDPHRRTPRLRVSIRYLSALILASLATVLTTGVAQASDASLKNALKAYEMRLTSDIGSLSSFTVPSKNAANGVLGKLSTIAKDLSGATRAANGQQASTSTGRTGRIEVLSALNYASTATRDARASASAAKAGKSSTARSDQSQEQSAINKAIPLFESGGKKLHLF
jgi:hypothetical protein